MSTQRRQEPRGWSGRKLVVAWLVTLTLAFITLFLFGRYGIVPNRWAQHVLSHYPNP